MNQEKLIILVVILLLLFLFFTHVGKLIRKSLLFYLIIMFPYRKWHLPSWLSGTIIIEENIFKSHGRTIISDVYRPQDNKKYPGMFVFAPLAEEGRRNLLVVNFLKGLARLGYTVTAPFWPTRGFGNIYLTDIDDFTTAFKWFQTQPHVCKKPIGVVAVSYGTGPALIAIKKYHLEQDIKFLALISGFIDLLETIKALITKEFQYKNIKGKMTPEPYAYTVMLKTAAIWSEGPDGKIFSKIADNDKISDLGKKLSKVTNSLTAAGKKILSWYLSSNKQEFADRYKKLSKKIQRYFQDLSPTYQKAFPKIPMLILHSKKDNLIPHTQSIKLYDLVKKRTNSTLVLISAFDHTMPVPANLKNIFTIYLSNIFRVTRFLFKILSFK